MRRASQRETVVLRALGSAVRQEILERLVQGPATSAMLARALQSNTGVMSYHLRELGKAGLTEPAERQGRELFWRLSHQDIRFADPSRSAVPELAQATIDLTMQRLAGSVRGYLDRGDLGDEWRDASLFSQSATALTVTDLSAFTAEYLALLQRWTSRPAPRGKKLARPVRIAFFAFPDEPTPDGGPSPDEPSPRPQA
jgi:DNA-binding transcriptional ArsR family regulator